MVQARYHALVVDDEPDIRELLDMTLAQMEVASVTAADLTEARAALGRRPFDLCLTDLRLPDGNGIELVREIQRHHPETPVAVFTAHGNMDAAVEALKAGAFDFVNKPVELKVLRELVNTALKLSNGMLHDRRSRHQLLGDSPVMRGIRSKIVKLARSQAPIYISGESGTGKELVARLIHEKGPRAEKPFVPVNCGAIPEEIIESELFGHVRGSFTGATANKEGLFQAADGGTLFLDEIGDLPLHLQVKLLRAIQEKAVRPVGSQSESHVDVRILSATHADLAGLVQEGRFREDLFYRINVIELNVPSLRERIEDLPMLVEHISARLAAQFGLPKPGFSDDAMAALTGYDFPGNVRELENILERALTLAEAETITGDELQLPRPAAAGSPAATRPGQKVQLEPYLAAVEKELILDALAHTDNNKTAAAKRLGISFRALRYRLKKLGLD